MIVAVILAGGVGSRVGADRPKQFVEVCGKPILAYTAEIYQKHPEVDAIEIVCHKSWKDYLHKMIEKYSLTKVKWIADGGNTFQESVINGVNFLRNAISLDDIVMIHYGASPFTSQEIITDSIKVCKENNMAASCIPCYQLMGTNDGKKSEKWVDRDALVQISCPQSFKFSYILDIYKRAAEKGLLDKIEPHTTSLMYALGDVVFQSYGDQSNIKITTKEDVLFFEYYLQGKEKTNCTIT